MTGEAHLEHGDGETAVRPVVVGEHPALLAQLRERRGEALEELRLVEVGRRCGGRAADEPRGLRQHRSAEAIPAAREVDEHEHGVTLVGAQLRRPAAAHIADRRERRDDERHGRDHGLRRTVRRVTLAPRGTHRQRILADGDGDAERGTELLADRLDRGEERGVLAGFTAGRHPVGGEPHIAERADIGREDVGDGLGDREPRRGRRVEQRDRRALAHRHRLAGVAEVVGRGDAAVRHRHLPGPDHLVARDHAADRTVADGDEEGLVGHRREPQHAAQRLARVDARGVEGLPRRFEPLHIAGHARRLAEQHLDGHVDRRIAEQRIAHQQPTVVGERADDRERAALACAERREAVDGLGRHHEHIALLRLVAPELHRRHAGLVVEDGAQVDHGAAAAVCDRLRHGVRKTTCADIVDEQDGVGHALRPAAVDDLLRAPLHLGVAALHRREIEVGRRSARADRRRRTAAEPDEHRGAAEHDDLGARRAVALLDMVAAHVAHAARDHDRLVVTAHAARRIAGRVDLERAEVAADRGTAELIVEGGRADRPLEHDVERRGDAARLAEIGDAGRCLPGLREVGDAQMRDREADEPRLGLGADAGRALVADLTAGAGRGAREGRDRGRVVVRLHLHQDVDGFRMRAVDARRRVREPAQSLAALDDRGVVAVGAQHALRRARVGVADHGEQRLRLALAVDDPVGVEDLVAAMLGVRLREHHELDVARVAAEGAERSQQVVDLVGGERESELGVGAQQRLASRGERHAAQRPRRLAREQRLRLVGRAQHGLGHAVVQQRCRSSQRRRSERPRMAQPVLDAALDAAHRVEPADLRDVGGLAGPRRDGPGARHDPERGALAGADADGTAPDASRVTGRVIGRIPRPVGQQRVEARALVGRQVAPEVDEVDERRGQAVDVGRDLAQPRENFGDPEGGQRGGPADRKHATVDLFLGGVARRRRVHGTRELRDVAALPGADLADALLRHLVDAQHGVHGQEAALHARELRLDALFGGVDDDAGTLAEHELLDLDEAEHLALADLAGVDLVDLALVDEDDLVDVLRGHALGAGKVAERVRFELTCRD